MDIIAALIQQPDYQTARKYWNRLKERLKKEGSQSVTNCHQLKLPAADGKSYLTDVADPETLLRIIQSVLSPIHQEWSGVSVKKHKDLKGLKTQNLRDHMSEAGTGTEDREKRVDRGEFSSAGKAEKADEGKRG